RKPAVNGFLLLLPRRRAAEHVSLFALGNRDQFYGDVLPHLLPASLQQGPFELFQLRAGGPHQILTSATTQGLQVGLTDDAAVKHPHPPCLAVLAFHHPQHRLQRADIGPFTISAITTCLQSERWSRE